MRVYACVCVQQRRGLEKGATTHINKQVLPQAPSPTMTSFRRISAMVCVCRLAMMKAGSEEGEAVEIEADKGEAVWMEWMSYGAGMSR